MRVLEPISQPEQHTLIRARYLAGELSARELARRTARELGDPSCLDALHQQISRAERNLGVRMERSALEAMVAVLDCPLIRAPIDLCTPYRWAFRNTLSRSTIDMEWGEPMTWLGGKLTVFSDVCHAFEARGWVTDREGRVVSRLE